MTKTTNCQQTLHLLIVSKKQSDPNRLNDRDLEPTLEIMTVTLPTHINQAPTTCWAPVWVWGHSTDPQQTEPSCILSVGKQGTRGNMV